LFSILFSGGRGRRKKAPKKAKKHPEIWFETYTVSQPL
jgi:hypothetical protein